MPFSHHSHSGQFCPGHARNTLAEMLATAVAKKMSVFALTEHMPRHEVDFYPEEQAAGDSLAGHLANERAYLGEALRLRASYASAAATAATIGVPIGFECDWIREGEGPEASVGLIEQSLALRLPTASGYGGFDFFVGSVHHVHTVPIDYTRQDYMAARAKSGGRDEQLFEDYFDAQLAMLRAVRPPVVGHFDLIRLLSDEPDGRVQRWQGVWEKVLRNLAFMAGYGAFVEVNFSAVRKGMREPYPQAEIAHAFLARGGRFVLSDDSHAVDQVAFGYAKLLPFLDKVAIQELYFLGHAPEPLETPHDERFPHLVIGSIGITALKEHPFWTVNGDGSKP